MGDSADLPMPPSLQAGQSGSEGKCETGWQPEPQWSSCLLPYVKVQRRLLTKALNSQRAPRSEDFQQ